VKLISPKDYTYNPIGFIDLRVSSLIEESSRLRDEVIKNLTKKCAPTFHPAAPTFRPQTSIAIKKEIMPRVTDPIISPTKGYIVEFVEL
jgi:hypothetical protein